MAGFAQIHPHLHPYSQVSSSQTAPLVTFHTKFLRGGLIFAFLFAAKAEVDAADTVMYLIPGSIAWHSMAWHGRLYVCTFCVCACGAFSKWPIS